MGRARIVPRQLPRNMNPTGTRCIMLTLPDDDEWEHLAYSTLYDQLALVWMNWQRDGDQSGQKMCLAWRHWLRTWRYCPDQPIATIGEDQSMPEWRTVCDNNVEYVEFKACVCPETWIRLARADQLNQPGQPGTGAGTPMPGGSAQECIKMIPSQGALMPWTVNTGDTLTLDSCVGSAWDGTEGSPLGVWRLGSNGDQVFGGVDVGNPRTVSTDPVNTAPHMSIVAAIGTTPVYIDLPVGVPVTVPTVPTNSQVRIQNNTSSYTAVQSSGEDICVSVKNNAAGTFSHTFDFLASPGGWIPWIATGTNPGSWSGGTGWISGDNTLASSGGYSRGVWMLRDFASRTITEVKIFYDLILGSPGGGSDLAFALGLSGTLLTYLDYSHVPVGVNSIDWTGSLLGTELQVQLNSSFGGAGGPPTFSGAVTITKIIVSGIGTDPF